MLNANGELNDAPQAKIFIRSTDDQSRIILTDLKINKFTTPYWYSEESQEYGFEITPQSLRENRYLETYIVAPNVILSDRNNYYMSADYIQRKPAVSTPLALYSDQPIIKKWFQHPVHLIGRRRCARSYFHTNSCWWRWTSSNICKSK